MLAGKRLNFQEFVFLRDLYHWLVELKIFHIVSGGKRTLKIPPELGYGVRGAGCKGGKTLVS